MMDDKVKIRKIKLKDITAVAELIKRNFDEIMSYYHSYNIIENFKNCNTEEKLMIQMKWKEIFIAEINNVEEITWMTMNI